MTAKTKVAALISGRGSNMEALVRAAKDPACPFEIALVLANKADAGGLATAEAAGIEALCVPSKPFGKDREAHERAVDAALRERGIEVIALAGYMRILTPFLVDAWEGRMLNIHPSLLPKYPGLDTHARAIAAGDAEAGCTVHLVTAGVDEGPILGQARVAIEAGDDDHALAARVLKEEHRLYPAVLGQFVRGL
ncbi:phosphoribosylglycinamide formyltransferase [Caulobacter sp. D4A]|uniref:phosphoribosylglycinamide formyltransferase n=1 Tax=unclassified Caulobacter TaxID=2648921 RepID=UPI000D732A08|nr:MULTISPECIES: phosphoribosylglycinamide formyltransferase [unclassified Caulobacter]PXA80216.1 phosphoribosylglycinamide formyltransferase [Caulobacter sp. D4A]PXA87614.1 phosphoribosylglycinamide formyltransferase [Caulobacter sp. D5]